MNLHRSSISIVRFFVLLLLAILCAQVAQAFDVEMQIEPRVIRLGESTVCKIILHDAGRVQPPSLPALAGFDIVSTGQEQSFQFNNGHRSSQVAYTFQLTPQAAGDFQIGPFRYDTGQGAVDIPAIQVQVLAPDNPGTPQQAQKLSDLMYATLTINRPTLYTHEVFDLTLNLYIQSNLSIDRNVGLVDFETTGLSLEGFQEIGSSREAVNGTIYDVRRFRTKVTALASGTFNLAPRLRVNIIVPSDRTRRRDPFFGDGFFGVFDSPFNRVETRPQIVETRPLSLQISDLPTDGRPSSFSGAVGRYSFDVTAAPLDLRVGEPITLTMRIQGNGSMDAISAPKVNLTDDFRSYDARLIEQQPNAGLKTFEQVIIPRKTSIKELPAISFSYFDTDRGKYETIVRGPFPLTLAAAPAGTATPVVQAANNPITPTKAEPLGSDLVYLKTAPKHWKQAKDDEQNFAALDTAITALPALALIAVFGYVRRREHAQQNPHEGRRRRAPRKARAGLARCNQFIKSGDIHGAAQALSDALSQFYGPLLNLPPGQISADIVCRRLEERGLSQGDSLALQNVFATCERLRYSGSGSPSSESAAKELEQVADKLSELLRESQKVMR